jgi:RHS repeat-associated protein
MKKIIYLLVLLPILVFSQTQTENYVKTTTYKVNTQTSIASPTVQEASQNITYYDGLGRPMQQIASKQTPTGKDIVTHIAYDAFGRQAKDYLPYAATQNTLAYIDGATAEQNTINQYQSLYGSSNPFSEKQFESSPLNRVMEQAAPGDDWSLANTDKHTIRLDYQTNDVNEVASYTATTTWSPATEMYDINLVDNGFYDPNQLYKTVTKNENWMAGDHDKNTTQEFKDKEGHVVLKRNFIDNDPVDTYYVYDIYGNLTYVIPPMPSAAIAAGSPPLGELEGAYQYRYDYRNRLVEKKLPGKQWEYIVYDKLDRVVATGPAFNPFGGSEMGWMITKYDVFSRPAYTAWLPSGVIDSMIRHQYQTQINNNLLNERRVTTNVIDNITLGYSNDVKPILNIKLLTVNYYDNYSYPNPPVTTGLILGQHILDNVKGLATGSWVRVITTEAETLAETSSILYDYQKARPIQTQTNNYLDGYTKVQSLYNFAGQVLQTVTQHKRLGSSPIITVTEDFDYSPQGRLVNHFHTIGGEPKQLLAHNDYNELGQLITKNVGGQDITTFHGLQKVDYQYNIRGWLTDINNIGSLTEGTNPTDMFAFKIRYNNPENEVGENTASLYNGNIAQTYWRTSSDNIVRKYGYTYDSLNRLNNAMYIKPNESVPITNSYNESLSYDKNGNIMALQRTGSLDSNSGITVDIDNLTYNYANGNQSNQLLKVTDGTNNPNGFKDDSDGTNDTNDDYSYDLNGNMTSDENKGITAITYNHLNLPTNINFGTLGNITYLYNAVGQKLKKVVLDNSTGTSTTTITDYLDGYQYKNGLLQFFPTAEGYVNCNAPKLIAEVVSGVEKQVLVTNATPVFSYVYNYTDHLGNIRLSYSQDPVSYALRVIEENHYYPFGLKHNNYNSDTKMYVKENEILKVKPVPALFKTSYGYKYNGKEYQDELGLNMYDYGARNYDPADGRWWQVDPLAEKSRRFSPYCYAVNNPVFFIDPDGMQVTPPDWVMREDKSVHWDNNATSQSTTKSGETYLGKEASYTSQLGTTVNLHADKSWDSNMVIGNKVPEETKVATESVFDLKTAGEITQNIGDAVTAIGICTGQPEICAIGEGVGKIGLAAVITADIMDKGLTNETAISSGVKIGLSIGFGALGKAGVNATKTVAGHEAVEAGANKVSEGIIQATTMATEKTLGNAIEQKVDPKVNEE